ncbi:MAG: 16S rRNA (guanine(527)-N(7))-methyltransferase RsmG [Oscillospiraceae bacterium]|nr:16S rRNA (guanine(527)-N(7))-methyltransferase RsmG [Oscillospiraceae bacterium]
MEIESIGPTFARGAEELGVVMTPSIGVAFQQYYSYLAERNATMNLTAISGVRDVVTQHFLDSIALVKFASFQEAHVIDIGSGAGFPGVPLKLVEPSIKLTLLEATLKRVEFLSSLCSKLDLEVACICARAEELSKNPDVREKFDIAVSRGVARMNVLSELCLPFVRVGGILIAMKSVTTNEELAESRVALLALGAEERGCFDYTIPGTNITHRAIVINKTSRTPEKYPRRFARIQKSPL